MNAYTLIPFLNDIQYHPPGESMIPACQSPATILKALTTSLVINAARDREDHPLSPTVADQ